MILVHGTSKKASSEIIESNTVNPSKFNFNEYIEALFTHKSTGNPIPKNLNGQHVMWLGEGVYAFESTDYKLAKTWRTRYGNPKIPIEDCAVIKINIDFEAVKNNIVNFSTNEGKSILLKFLDTDFDELIKQMYDVNPNVALKLSHLKNLGYNIIKEKFVDAPYALGLFIGFMVNSDIEEIRSSKLIKATFSKENKTSNYLETYVCIKDYSIIQSIQVC